MTVEQFDQIIEYTVENLYEDCGKHPNNYRKSGEDFEPFVYQAVCTALERAGIDAMVDYTPGGHGFPDIVVEGNDGKKYGIEVKSSIGTGKKWKINGNSILGSTRVPGLIKNVIVFGKLKGSESEFRAKEYEKSISDVVVTHSPRYAIDLDLEEGNSFFERSNLSYTEISASDNPIKLITDYFLREGQSAWWLAESTPAAIQMFGKLDSRQQAYYMGYAFAHYPELFSNSGTKFYRFMTWLASEKSVIDPALRDRFTAGGKANVELEDVVYERLPRIFTNLHENRRYVLGELENGDLQVLEIDWNIKPKKVFRERILQWAQLVASVIPDSGMEHFHKEQMLVDILLDPE